MGERLLLVEDDARLAEMLSEYLGEAGFHVAVAPLAATALAKSPDDYDAVVLDLTLPDRDGLDVCRDLRAFTSVPLIVLSARHGDRDKAALLDAGADDYVTKPFSTLELQARVRAQLRRAARLDAPSDRLVIGSLEIDLARRVVRRNGEEVHLTPTEWALLRAFVANRGRTLTHQQLFHATWGRAEGDAQQYLRVYVSQLRRKLEEDPVRPTLIRTDPAVGYRFDPEP